MDKMAIALAAQQQEYIITEQDMEELADYANAEDAEACIRSICDKIRSRPATSPDVDCSTCKFGEQCRPLAYVPPCYNHGPDSPEHAAVQAREKVLDICLTQMTLLRKQVLDYMDTGYEGSSNEMKDINKMFFKRVKNIESLRSTTEAQK
jgi:hypothetical protein